jgi:GNAT superfamily N-acetyltransferase
VARPEDVPGLAALSRAVYGPRGSWETPELLLHQEVFLEGQLVAEEVDDVGTGLRLLGMSVSLVVDSERCPPRTPWREVTDRGRLTTHDPSGDLLYGAGLAVHPETRGRGVARALYAAREALVERLGIGMIRAGARIPGYGAVAHLMTAEAYVREVVEGSRRDPTLSFQLRMGFHVVDVAPDYLVTDEASRRWAAIIEWRRPPRGS